MVPVLPDPDLSLVTLRRLLDYEFERSLSLSRTHDGRQAAMARGVASGRPKKMRPDQHELARQLVLEGKSISAVARTFNVHPATIYRCLEENSSL
jgi:DNA invertase Pin-like site-specific DNA recombinase